MKEIEDWINSNTWFAGAGDADISEELIAEVKNKIKVLVNLEDLCRKLEFNDDVKDMSSNLLHQIHEVLNLLRTKLNSLERQLTPTIEQKEVQTSDIETQTQESQFPMSKVVKLVPQSQNSQRVIKEITIMDDQPTITTTTTYSQTTKPTEDILIVKSVKDGHETIQIDSQLSPQKQELHLPDSIPEDITVEANYKKVESGSDNIATELVLKNIPTSFETTFVEPNETTTEVIIDPDGTKRIILRKIIRTRSQIVQHSEYQVDNNGKIIEGTAFEAQPSEAQPSEMQIRKSSINEGDIAFFRKNEVTGEPSDFDASIKAVVEQVTRRVITKTRKIIKRIAIIDGKEHVIEEVVDGPEDVEINEDYSPNLNLNLLPKTQRYLSDDCGDTCQTNLEFVEVPVTPTIEQEPQIYIEQIQTQAIAEVVQEIVNDEEEEENQQSIAQTIVEKIPLDIIVDSQVFESIEKAPVELINLPVKAPVLIDNESSNVELNSINILPPSDIKDVTEIWPDVDDKNDQIIEVSQRQSLTVTTTSHFESDLPITTTDLTNEEKIWPEDDIKTFNLDEYHYEKRIEATTKEEDNVKQITKTDSPIIEESKTATLESVRIHTGFLEKVFDKSTPVESTDEVVEEPISEQQKQSLVKEEVIHIQAENPMPPKPNILNETSIEVNVPVEVQVLIYEQVQIAKEPKPQIENVHTVEQPIVTDTQPIEDIQQAIVIPEGPIQITTQTLTTEIYTPISALQELQEPTVPIRTIKLDVNEATKLFLENEVYQKPGKKSIKISMPSMNEVDKDLSVSMKLDQSDTKVNINLTEEIIQHTIEDTSPDTTEQKLTISCPSSFTLEKPIEEAVSKYVDVAVPIEETPQITSQVKEFEEMKTFIPEEEVVSVKEDPAENNVNIYEDYVDSPREVPNTGLDEATVPEFETIKLFELVSGTELDEPSTYFELISESGASSTDKSVESETDYEPEDTTIIVETKNSTENINKIKQKIKKTKTQKERGQTIDETLNPISSIVSKIVAKDHFKFIEEDTKSQTEAEILKEEIRVISSDESYNSIKSEDDSTKDPIINIMEEAIAELPEEDSKPIGDQLVLPAQVLEATYLDDVEQQTSLSFSDDILEHDDDVKRSAVVVESRSMQTSLDLSDENIDVSIQTSLDAEKFEQTEQEIQTNIAGVLNIETQTSVFEDILEIPNVDVKEYASIEVQTVEDNPKESSVVVNKDKSIEKQFKIEEEFIQQNTSKSDSLAEYLVSDILTTMVHDICTDKPKFKSEGTNTTVVNTQDTATITNTTVSTRTSLTSLEENKKEDDRIQKTYEISQDHSAASSEMISVPKNKLKKIKHKKRKGDKYDIVVEATFEVPQNNGSVQTESTTTENIVTIEPPTSPEQTIEILENNLQLEEIIITKDIQQHILDVNVQFEQEPVLQIGTVEQQILQSGSQLSDDIDDHFEILEAEKEEDSERIYADSKYKVTSNPNFVDNFGYLVSENDDDDKQNDVRLISIREQIETLQNAHRQNNVTVTKQTIITVTETIYKWIVIMNNRLRVNYIKSNDDTTKSFEEICILRQEIETIEEYITTLGRILGEKNSQHVEPIRNHIYHLKNSIHDKENEYKSKVENYEEFIFDIGKLTLLITELQQKFENVITEDISIEKKLLLFDEIDVLNNTCVQETNRLLNCTKSVLSNIADKTVIQDIYECGDNAKYIENNVALERNRLLQLLSLADEYEQTLMEFKQITLLADKLVDSPIHTNSLVNLQQELQRHRKFFINLSHCRAILESLEKNLDSDTREKHSTLHQTLHIRATNILDKASERAQKLAMAASKWTVLDKAMKEERQWLQVAEQRIPNLSSVTSADYDQYFTLYQSVSNDISQHQAKMMQLANISKKLQDLVNAPKLEEESNASLIVVLKLKDEVSSYLKRLITFREAWSTYYLLSEKNEKCIKGIEHFLKGVEMPIDFDNQPIKSMCDFWEIKAQFEVNKNIKKDAETEFENAITIIPVADEMVQREYNQQLDERWNILSDKINEIQSSIIDSISSKDVPINEKIVLLEKELDELNHTISGIKGIIKNEEDLTLYIERVQIYNSRIVMIGNELGRIGLSPTTESEKIGQLFNRSYHLSSILAEELENGYILRDQINSIQQGINRITKKQETTREMLDQSEANLNLGSDVIETSVFECKLVEKDLLQQWQDIMHLRQLLHTLPMRLRMSVSPVQLERNISKLQDTHLVLEARCVEIFSKLSNCLKLWKRFERQLEIVQQSVQETDYMIDLLTVRGHINYDRLLKTTQRLEVRHININSILNKKNKNPYRN